MKINMSQQFKCACVVVEPDDTFEEVKKACYDRGAVRQSKPSKESPEVHDLFCIQVPSQGVPQQVTEKGLHDAVPIEMRQRGSIHFGGGMDREAWLDIAEREGYTVRIKGAFAELWSHATKKELADQR